MKTAVPRHWLTSVNVQALCNEKTNVLGTSLEISIVLEIPDLCISEKVLNTENCSFIWSKNVCNQRSPRPRLVAGDWWGKKPEEVALVA